MKKINDILSYYKDFYSQQIGYYHDFNHAKWVVLKGDSILRLQSTIDYESRLVFASAMACHDAGHLNGLQNTDRNNVDIALCLFNSRTPDFLNKIQLQAARAIIDSTCTPYISIQDVLQKYNLKDDQDLMNLIMVARDVDHLGIIGIEDEILREMALVGLMKELLVKIPAKVLMANIHQGTNDFFESINFYTQYAKDWADKNLVHMKEWQLGFAQRAIELAI